ncbi:zinc-dependent peptidase [Foetidibacter luteolus]|uniref:M90 family metallopeptidase n=1 Tax=Foetidibacter luteolus TaxID=2608880 RepID=UPI00129B66C8|nr:M90 family metallopeptidase [Foetidibacter luteolus]
MTGLLLFIVCAGLLGWFLFRKPQGTAIAYALPANYQDLLMGHVAFYRSLDEADRLRFVARLQEFLGYTRVHGVNTSVDELDKLLVASSAVIPIFGFSNWHYHNLRDVLLYEDAFNSDDFTASAKDNTLGMVGTGAMQRMMILSKPALRQGFQNDTDKNNTGIHEFVHLLDKADGEVDGIPEQLLHRQYCIPWLNEMNESIQEIKKGRSDINPYGSTNKAEFFAVAAEYFFERPGLFKKKHPELYELMEEAFNQQPATDKPSAKKE